MTAPAMDERREVALRMREYKCPVLPSQQTTREAVDAVVECMGLEDDEEMCTVRYFLDRLADLIDPGEGMDEDGRAALDWVREHGGLERVKNLLNWVVGHCSTKQQLDFDFWLSGRVMHELGFEEDMADREEVERRLLARLMPEGMEWPRFDDLEPVRIGDDFMDMHGRVHTVASVRLKEGGEFSLVGTDRWWQGFPAGSRVGRPEAAPKVLDADGVEIRVGDEVWSTAGEFDEKRTVKSVHSDPDELPYVLFEEGRAPWSCLCRLLTHRAPVLAADGEPLEVGQTVWATDGRGPYTVDMVPDGVKRKVVRLVDENGTCWSDKGFGFTPDQLTHHRPALDAEGNRIEPAMDVWWVCEGDERGIHAEKLHVESVGEDGLVTCDPYNGGTWVHLDPSELHVKKPVLDADGVPVREGDTVYGTVEGVPFIVTEVSDKGSVFVDAFPGTGMHGLMLTHTKPEPPDSWEKVEEDARGLDSGVDRGLLTHTHVDIVRRCKALAERGE